MIELLDRQQSLTANQWKIFAASILSIMLDFFDFLLIGFTLAFFVRDWHLTYGQSGLILFSSGVAAVPGAIFFGWLGDKIGRRKVFMITILMFSLATGAMALTPERSWAYLAVMRFIVGFGVVGVASVDMPLLQEFVPATKRGWISGLSIALVPGGGLLAATFAAFLSPIVGWRGLFALGLLPAFLAFLIRVWVPESPRWLIGRGRIEEARCSLGWALQIPPEQIVLPAVLPVPQKSSWLDLFKYPRSIAAGALVGLSQTGAVGLGLWMVTLLVLVLRITPAEASFLVIWISLAQILGRCFGSWITDIIGRRTAGALCCALAAAATSLAGYLHAVNIGAVPMFFALLLVQGLFGNSNSAISYPYMAEMWPGPLRASGFGLVYGISNLGKFIGPAGLAVIIGASNYVSPKATIDGIIPGFNYFAVWYVLAVVAYLFIGFETRGRTIEELDAALTRSKPLAAAPEAG
ncbi:MAG: MFS transporter [Alphaproteobacteria bacterium]|nr:MFS transporter [Alphaproteobacteria bacterium]MBV9201554.1 MFS transporter [Alphaproteobacteria bacterium]MBV9377379.1 MFS transporter [Alphaproteobacteria bacterium]